MRKVAWSTGFFVLGALAAGVMGDAACTVVQGNGDDGGASGGSSSSSSSGSSSGASSSSGSGSSSGGNTSSGSSSGSSSSSGSGGSSGADGGTCATHADTSVPACDQCIDAMCCAALDACTAPDEAGVDDAGGSQCISYVGCVLSLGKDDGGTLSTSESDCQGSPSAPAYSSSEVAQGNALLNCMQSNCATACPL